ncbi:MAG: DUF397 domain-containing protein [Streptosporangiaceae bacterium]
MNLNFRTSSYSGGEGNCIAVADDAGRVAVMDTKDSQGVILRFTKDVWRRFADQVKVDASLADLWPIL